MYFDCCCEIGPRNRKDPGEPWSVHDVLHWMDHCGIDGALVVHTLSINGDPIHARERLAAEIAVGAGRLFPVWGLLPPDAGDCELPPTQLPAAMNSAGVHAVKLFPRTHSFPFSADILGSTLQALEGERILTLLDWDQLPADQTTAYDALAAILKAFPKLPVVLQRIHWSAQRFVCALMERYENLHIEMSRYQIHRGPEVYARRFGAERLLFGTGLPAMSAGAARAFIDYAELSDDAKRKLAGENLSRLLHGITPLPAADRVADAVRDPASRGEALCGETVMDAHCHISHDGTQSAGAYVMYRGDAQGLLRGKDVLGIRTTAIVSWEGPLASDVVEGNTVTEAAVTGFPDRFIGVCYVNPTHTAANDMMREVRQRVEDGGFVGLKPYNLAGLRYDDALYRPCWEYANEKGLYVLLHVDGGTGGMESVETLGKWYPRAQWVVAHTGSSFPIARKTAAVMKTTPNVWAELTFTTVTNGLIEWLAAEVGDDRILFGTDAPMRDPRPQLGWVVWADLPVESRRRILGKNFERLLRMRNAPS